jgi:SET family sugar efflux transporter-like MFS transporter
MLLSGIGTSAATGLRVMLWVTAACWLLQIVPLGTLRAGQVAPGTEARPVERIGLKAMAPLLAFTGLYVLVYAGEAVKYGFLPVYMDENLHLAPAIRGAVIGIQPLVELLIMPLSVVLGRRMGILWLMCIGAAFGVAANLCFATTGSAAGMFAGQILMGGVWGIFAALGIIVAQRLLPGAVATASAIFISSAAVSSALGGLSGGLGVAVLGLPAVFFIPAGLGILAVVGLAVMASSGVLASDGRRR